jgi:hypothetical protein
MVSVIDHLTRDICHFNAVICVQSAKCQAGNGYSLFPFFLSFYFSHIMMRFLYTCLSHSWSMPHTIHTSPTLLLQVLAIFLAGGLPPIKPTASAPHSAVMVMSSSSARSRLGNPVTLFVGGLKPGQTKYHIVQPPLLFKSYSSRKGSYCCEVACSTNTHNPPSFVAYV